MTTTQIAVLPPGRITSSTGRLLRRTLSYPRTRVGLVLSVLVVALAVFGGFFAPNDPNALLTTPGSPPAPGFPLGGDVLGRDVLSRFLAGGAMILAIGAMATVVGSAVGIVIGLFAGAGSTKGGAVLSWITDVLLSFPQIVLPLLFIARLGPELWLLVLVVALNQFPQTTRLVKSITAEVYERDFVKVAVAVGLPKHRILFREVLPNILSPIFVDIAFRFSYAIALVASLSFIGFGAQPPDPDWGRMIYENKGFFSLQPWGVLAPMFAVLVLTLGAHLVSDGLARALGKDDAPKA